MVHLDRSVVFGAAVGVAPGRCEVSADGAPASGDAVDVARDRYSPEHPEHSDPRQIPVRVPKIMGVDVGSYGAAKNVIVRRHGQHMLSDITRFQITKPMTHSDNRNNTP